MSELGDKRRQFSKMCGVLLHYADVLGYDYAVDYVKRCRDCTVGHPNSTHKSGLAMDLHLYHFGQYITDGSGHKELHDFWDLMGGAPRIDHDMNHYSLEWQGVR